MKKYTVGTTEEIWWEWRGIEAESADEAVQIAKDHWTDAKMVSSEINDDEYVVKPNGKSWDESTIHRGA